MLNHRGNGDAFQVGLIQEFIQPFFGCLDQEYGLFRMVGFRRGDHGVVQLEHMQHDDLGLVVFGQGCGSL